MASSWAVTGQRQTTVNNGQTYVPAMIVSYKTGAGNFASITVAKDDYDPDTISGLLQQAADAIDAIGSLSSGTFAPPGPLDSSS